MFLLGDINERKIFCRRNFIKVTLASYFFTKSINPVDLTNDIEEGNNLALVMDQNYVVINGWVLLKSDVALD